jgi:hypothetical protein
MHSSFQVYGTYKIIRERFFLNEWVRFHIGAKATFARVVEVTYEPDDLEVQSDYDLPPPSCYRYVIEYLDHIKGHNVMVQAHHTQISRLPTYCSRNAIQKYFTEVAERDEASRVIFKKEELEKYGIEKMNWDHIFVLPAPTVQNYRKKGRSLQVDPNDSEVLTKRTKFEEGTPKPNEPSEWEKYKITEKQVKSEREKMAETRLNLWKTMELSDDLELKNLKV